MLLFANVLDHLEDGVDLLHVVVVEEAEASEAGGLAQPPLHQLHGVVVAVAAVHAAAAQLSGEMVGAEAPRRGRAQRQGEGGGPLSRGPAAVQPQLKQSLRN